MNNIKGKQNTTLLREKNIDKQSKAVKGLGKKHVLGVWKADSIAVEHPFGFLLRGLSKTVVKYSVCSDWTREACQSSKAGKAEARGASMSA
jgi:hypothetical protein